MSAEMDHWFVEQILPFEGALTAYLQRVWNDPHEIADLRQEVYVRAYASAEKSKPPIPRFFLFAIARNLLIDRLRHSRVVSIDLMEDLALLHLAADEITADRIISGRQELARLQRAMDELPPRCRETFVLRKIDGLSQKEAALKMGVSESTIEKQIVKAMRFLADRFWGHSSQLDGASSGEEGESDEKRR